MMTHWVWATTAPAMLGIFIFASYCGRSVEGGQTSVSIGPPFIHSAQLFQDCGESDFDSTGNSEQPQPSEGWGLSSVRQERRGGNVPAKSDVKKVPEALCSLPENGLSLTSWAGESSPVEDTCAVANRCRRHSGIVMCALTRVETGHTVLAGCEAFAGTSLSDCKIAADDRTTRSNLFVFSCTQVVARGGKSGGEPFDGLATTTKGVTTTTMAPVASSSTSLTSTTVTSTTSLPAITTTTAPASSP